MSLSVERVRHMLEVAKKERAESWGDMDEVGRSFSNDCVSAFDELLAIKEAEPVAWFKHGPYDEGEKMQAVCYNPNNDALYSPLIFKPE